MLSFHTDALPLSSDAGIEKPRAVPTDRVGSLDAARLIAIGLIIFLHTAESSQLSKFGAAGTFGVPFYLFAALYFQARSFAAKPQMLLHTYIWRRVKRLYIPMVAWTFIYIFVRDLKHHFFTHLPRVQFDYTMLWTGSAHHLWFLPLLMVVTVLAATLNRVCADRPLARTRLIYISAILGTALAVVPRPDWLNYATSLEGYFFHQCWRALPSVFLGLSLAWWLAFVRRGALFTPAMGFAGLLLTTAMISNQIIYGYSRLDRTLSGLGWLMVALAAWNAPWVPMLARLGRYSYGIYLIHVLIIEGLQAVLHHAGFAVSVPLDLCIMLATFTLSSLIAVAIAQVRWLRWLDGD